MRTLSLWSLIGALPVLLLTLLGVPLDTALAAAPMSADSLVYIAPLFLMGSLATSGNYTDMVIYQEEFQTGMVEAVTQFLTVFNEASRGAITLVPRALKGHYNKEAFFQDVADLVTRRSIGSVAEATVLPMTQDEVIGVKIDRKVGPVSQTIDAIKKAGMTEADASRAFGELAGRRKLRDMLNTALIAVETSIQGIGVTTNLNLTSASPNTLTTDGLQQGLSLFGDAQQDIVCWVTHSKPYNNVMRQLIADKVTGLTDLVTIQGAIPAWLGRPALVTDSPALRDDNGSLPDSYNVLGLVRGAVRVEESEAETFYTGIEPLRENLLRIFQSEHSFNITIKGHKWNVGVGGGVSPSDAALATTSNWPKVAYDDKLTAGVRVVVR
jgi:hypothetical protein